MSYSHRFRARVAVIVDTGPGTPRTERPISRMEALRRRSPDNEAAIGRTTAAADPRVRFELVEVIADNAQGAAAKAERIAAAIHGLSSQRAICVETTALAPSPQMLREASRFAGFNDLDRAIIRRRNTDNRKSLRYVAIATGNTFTRVYLAEKRLKSEYATGWNGRSRK